MKGKTFAIGLSNISDDECLVLLKSCKKEKITDDGIIIPEKSTEEAFEDVILIDRLLSVKKSYALMNRKHGLKAHLDAELKEKREAKGQVKIEAQKAIDTEKKGEEAIQSTLNRMARSRPYNAMCELVLIECVKRKIKEPWLNNHS